MVRGIGFSNLTINDFQEVSDLFDADVMEITLESAVAARNIPGGTAPNRVSEAIAEAKQMLAGLD